MSVSNPFEAWLTAWAVGMNATTRMLGLWVGRGPALSSTFSVPFGAPTGGWPFQANPWAAWMPQMGTPHMATWPMGSWPTLGPAAGMFPWMSGVGTSPFNMQDNAWRSLLSMAPMAQGMPAWSATLPWTMPGMAGPAANPSWDPLGLMKAWPAMMGSFGAPSRPAANDPTAAWHTAMASMTAAWAPFLGSTTPAPAARKPAEPFKLDDPFGLSAMTKMWMAWMPGQASSDGPDAPRRREPEPEPAPASAIWPWADWWKPRG